MTWMVRRPMTSSLDTSTSSRMATRSRGAPTHVEQYLTVGAASEGGGNIFTFHYEKDGVQRAAIVALFKAGDRIWDVTWRGYAENEIVDSDDTAPGPCDLAIYEGLGAWRRGCEIRGSIGRPEFGISFLAIIVSAWLSSWLSSSPCSEQSRPRGLVSPT